jgi:voltage-gated potassium channel
MNVGSARRDIGVGIMRIGRAFRPRSALRCAVYAVAVNDLAIQARVTTDRRQDVTDADPRHTPHESRLERWLNSRVARATTPRGAAIVIATTSTLVTVAAGIAMTITDHESYPSIGSGLWWAVQTTTTVGYGDNVPQSAAGRLVAAVVMLFGIGFLTVITAAITSTFVARSRIEESASSSSTTTAEQLRQLDRRLERIEALLAAAPARENPRPESDTPR